MMFINLGKIFKPENKRANNKHVLYSLSLVRFVMDV